MNKTSQTRKIINIPALVMLFITLFTCTLSIGQINQMKPYPSVNRWGSTVKREAQFVYGINAPVAMLLGQIQQESGGNPNITASDGGMGLTQFMKNTVTTIVNDHSELGPASPYNPTWAIRAQARYDRDLYDHVQGKDDCEKFAAALKSYNAGLGFVERAQKKSSNPETWFTVTEDIQVGQSQKNFIYSRWYPRIILYTHQRRYMSWGGVVCNVNTIPTDKYPFR